MFFISDAMAQTAGAAAAGGTGGLLMQIIPIILIFVVFWFFLIRPQQKRQKEHQKMCEALTKGDEIVTIGGLAGRIAEVSEQYVVIEISRVEGDHDAARRRADGFAPRHAQVDRQVKAAFMQRAGCIRQKRIWLTPALPFS